MRNKSSHKLKLIKFRSSLTRGLNFDFFSNRYVLALAAVSMFVAFIYQLLKGDLASMFWSVPYVGVYSFLVWALAREIDPDHNLTAYISSALSSVLLVFMPVYFNQALLLIFLLVVLSRMISRINGNKASLIDSILLTTLTLTITVIGRNFLVPLFTSIAFLFDFLLIGSNKRAGIFTLINGLISLYFVYNHGASISQHRLVGEHFFLILYLVVVFLVYALFIGRSVQAQDDLNNTKLEDRRIFSVRILFLWTTAVLSIQGGTTALAGLAGLWIILLTAPLVSLTHKLIKIGPKK